MVILFTAHKRSPNTCHPVRTDTPAHLCTLLMSRCSTMWLGANRQESSPWYCIAAEPTITPAPSKAFCCKGNKKLHNAHAFLLNIPISQMPFQRSCWKFLHLFPTLRAPLSSSVSFYEDFIFPFKHYVTKELIFRFHELKNFVVSLTWYHVYDYYY